VPDFAVTGYVFAGGLAWHAHCINGVGVQQGDCHMHAVIIPDSLPPCALPSLARSARAGTGVARDAQTAMRSASAADHDAALLVAALEDVAARRAALAWLVEADLLCRCLV
jgi:hypothetical protein